MKKIDEFLSKIHKKITSSTFLQYFTVFTRVLLAIAFIIGSIEKIFGLPFTSLGVDTAIGRFFSALIEAKSYYVFIGWMQLLAALLLLIPWTAPLGAVFYFPIVVNIWLITLSLHFRGTVYVTGLMFLGSLYLLCWEYPRIRLLLPLENTGRKNQPAKMYFLQMLVWGLLGVFFYAFMWHSNTANVKTTIGLLGFAISLFLGMAFGAFLTWEVSHLQYLKQNINQSSDN